MILLDRSSGRTWRTPARFGDDYSNMPLRSDQKSFSLFPISAVVAASMVVMALLQAGPATWIEALRYDRDAVTGGEAWRIVTGHFLHLSWSHLALNLAGLGLGTWLFGSDRAPVQWLLATGVSAVACGAGLWCFSSDVRWCVGLSGILHGLMVVGFAGWAHAGERWAWLLLAAVVGKMAWEQLGGDMPWADAMAGGGVITDAHLWGAVGGASFVIGELIWRGRKRQV
jgi:rhomboid family GlyGly-CTERM serine protease